MDQAGGFGGAVIALMIKKWRSLGGGKLGRTLLQKLAYFAKAKGIGISLSYELHRFGPFSQELSERLDWLQIYGVIVDVGQGSGSDYGPGPVIDELLESYRDRLAASERLIEEVIQQFMGQSGSMMELLSTTHFVQRSGGSERGGDLRRTIREVRMAKGSKFSEEEISAAVDFLRSRAL